MSTWHITGPQEMIAITSRKWKGLVNLKSSLAAAWPHRSPVRRPSGLLEETEETNLRLQRGIADNAVQLEVPRLSLPLVGKRLR